MAVFEVDASPEIGSPLAYDPTKEITEPLSCKGVIVLGDDRPIVLCAIDWLGVANESGDVFRAALAESVGTEADRVVVHALHQHDAPRCDLTAARILAEHGHAEAHYDVPFIRKVIRSAADAAAVALPLAKSVVSVSVGQADVSSVASNRRMLGPSGKVHTTRYTACKDPAIRELPVGVIDPTLRLLTFNGTDGPIAALSFYATHPQSYYRTGGANPDFPGMARNLRQQQTGVFHLHFNGAGGNIGAGKFNDGSHENRQVLASRVAEGMQKAWEARMVSQEIEVSWDSKLVEIPLAEHLNEKLLAATVANAETAHALRGNAAAKLAYVQRIQSGHKTQISCLRIGTTQLLFMPGELFVEYQLAAQHMKPNSNVMMAAYGEYGTQYIGTRISFGQGGYETSERATNVSPHVELVLVKAMRELLDAEDGRVLPSDFTELTGLLPVREKSGDVNSPAQ